MFVGRKSELGQLKVNVKRRQNALVLGQRGIGKTALLKKFALISRGVYWRDCNNTRPLLLKICRKTRLRVNGKSSVAELLDKLAESNRKKKLVVLIDDIHGIRRKAADVLGDLAELEWIVIIGAAEFLPKSRVNWIFDKRIGLPPLSRKDAKRILGRKYSEKLYRESRGIPLALKSGGWHPCTRMQRVDLLPLWMLAPLAYLFLAIRYLALAEGETGFYIIVGLLGFTALSMSHMRKK